MNALEILSHISGSKQWLTFKWIAYWQCRTNFRCIITVRTDTEETTSAHRHSTHNTKRKQSQFGIDKQTENPYDLVSADVRLSKYFSGLSHNQAVHCVFQILLNRFNVHDIYAEVSSVKQSRQIEIFFLLAQEPATADPYFIRRDRWDRPILDITYLLTYVLTYLLTPWSSVLEKLTSSQLVKKFLAFYGIRRYINAFISARHLSLSWTSSIQPTARHPTSWRSQSTKSHFLFCCLGRPRVSVQVGVLLCERFVTGYIYTVRNC